jgi:hypothetical protein
MVTNAQFRNIALAFPDTVELPHFETTSFRVARKIFATLSEGSHIANFKLSLFDQAAFCSADIAAVSRIGNKWGLQGWTSVDLSRIHEDLLAEIISAAFCEVAPAKIKAIYLHSRIK